MVSAWKIVVLCAIYLEFSPLRRTVKYDIIRTMSTKQTSMSRDSLGDRMKSYEELSTSRRLMPNCPIYARIDGRAFHTFCRGLHKPYSTAFIMAMEETCKYLVKETTASLGYVQSDEISLGWTDAQHCPFDGRIQKLESVLASMASAYFVWHVTVSTPRFRDPIQEPDESSEEFRKRFDEWLEFDCDNLHMRERMDHNPPSFDCRVFNVPNLDELANAFLWRENDAIKNSITGMALNFYSHNELQNRNSDEKVHMMRMKGYCFYEDTEEAFLRGTFWQRENYQKELADAEIQSIPEDQRNTLMPRLSDGKCCMCWRSRISKLDLPYRLTDIENKVDALFAKQFPILNKVNPTFALNGK